MKIVITANEGHLASGIHRRFGDAPWLLCIDTRSGAVEAVGNADRAAAPDTEIRTARRVVALGARAVLTGSCGPAAYRILRAADILVYRGIEGTAAKARDWYGLGLLLPSGAPDPVEAASAGAAC